MNQAEAFHLFKLLKLGHRVWLSEGDLLELSEHTKAWDRKNEKLRSKAVPVLRDRMSNSDRQHKRR